MKRRFLVIALIVVLFILFALYGSTLYFLNQMFVHRMEKLVTTPQDLRLSGETVALTSADSIPLKTWWVPVEAPRGVGIVLHGMDGQDASTMLDHAQSLHEAGYATLALDMRAHGRSSDDVLRLFEDQAE